MNDQQAKSIFLHAIEHVAQGQWPPYLDEACAGDASLRHDVELLLAAHQESEDLAEQVRRACETTLPTIDAPALEQPGTRIGPYQLLQQIGEGGMGVVYLAEQKEPITRQVALKIVKPGMDTRQVIARFEAERQVLALMDHAHIAKVLDAGTTAAGRPYFIMELVQGVPITEYCDEQQLTLPQRLELFISVCHAIQHAHQKGIIHRDIKPTNVLVALYDGVPAAKVIDFGVAKATAQKATEKTTLTGFGQLIGTLDYMSPEQAHFNHLDIDTRSDVYSLGVLLYELLTGTTPFEQARRNTLAFDETLRIIREEEPPRPSARLSQMRSAESGIRSGKATPHSAFRIPNFPDLDWIVMKCLEKDRNRRYQTADGLASDVGHYLKNEPVLACPPAALYRLKKFAQRNKGILAVSALGLLALAVMAVSVGWALRDRAAQALEIKRARTARLATVEGQVRDCLSLARRLVAEDKLASAREMLVQATAHLVNDRPALPKLAAQVQADQAELDRFQQFLDLIDRAYQAETAPLVKHAPQALAPATANLVITAELPAARTSARRPAAAVPLLLAALARYDMLARDDWEQTLHGGLLAPQQIGQIRSSAYEVLLWLADDVIRRQHEHSSAQRLSRQAAVKAGLAYLDKAARVQQPTQSLYLLRARCRQALGEGEAAAADTQRAEETPASIASDHFQRGRAAFDAKNLAEGVEAFGAALRLEPTHYWSLMNLGYCQCDLGQKPEDFAAAAQVFTGCILKRPDHAHAWFCRANSYCNLRRYEDALADYSKALALDSQHADAWHARGRVYVHLKKLDQALADLNKAIELNATDPSAWNDRGVAHRELRQWDQALADHSRAIELNRLDAESWNYRGDAHYLAGKLDQAFADFQRATELDPKFATAWDNLGIIYGQRRQWDQALAGFTKAIELEPQRARYWNNRGWVFHLRHQSAQAAPDLTRAVELDPQFAVAWENLGDVHCDLQQWDQAIADYSQVIQLNPKLARVNPKLARVLFARGVVYRKLNQLDLAFADYSRVVELNPKYLEAWNNLGVINNQFGEPDKAVPNFSKAIELDSKFAAAWYGRGIAYRKLSQWPAAVADGAKAVELAPQEARYWKSLGLAQHGARDWQAAVGSFEEFLKRYQGQDVVIWLVLAMDHHRLGHSEEARRYYQQAVDWMEANQPALEKDAAQADELRGFRAQVEELLQLKPR